mmetsp:Transcript_5838/g.10616  ORF Transcript_5838/g.10616 Transcript_5838/m.10616 type:complete len:418 (+) Transcript_5838:4621-5874(+)
MRRGRFLIFPLLRLLLWAEDLPQLLLRRVPLVAGEVVSGVGDMNHEVRHFPEADSHAGELLNVDALGDALGQPSGENVEREGGEVGGLGELLSAVEIAAGLAPSTDPIPELVDGLGEDRRPKLSQVSTSEDEGFVVVTHGDAVIHLDHAPLSGQENFDDVLSSGVVDRLAELVLGVDSLPEERALKVGGDVVGRDFSRLVHRRRGGRRGKASSEARNTLEDRRESGINVPSLALHGLLLNGLGKVRLDLRLGFLLRFLVGLLLGGLVLFRRGDVSLRVGLLLGLRLRLGLLLGGQLRCLLRLVLLESSSSYFFGVLDYVDLVDRVGPEKIKVEDRSRCRGAGKKVRGADLGKGEVRRGERLLLLLLGRTPLLLAFLFSLLDFIGGVGGVELGLRLGVCFLLGLLLLRLLGRGGRIGS